MIKKYWGLLFLIGLLYACDESRVYEDTIVLKKAYWLADSIKTFDFTIDNNKDYYNLLLSLRNGREYPHYNIYINYAILDSTNQVLDEELRNFQLFDQKTGYPFGNGSGNLYEHQFELLTEYQFPYNGDYKIRYEQYMRYDSLPEVYSIGARVERVVN